MYLTQRGVRNVSLEESDNPHRILYREPAATPDLACDYHFFSVASDDDKLEYRHVYRHGRLREDVCNSHGGTQERPDTFSVRFGAQFLQEFGYPRMVLKTGCEPSIIAWAAAVQREWAKEDTEQRHQLILRQSPRGSHASRLACI